MDHAANGRRKRDAQDAWWQRDAKSHVLHHSAVSRACTQRHADVTHPALALIAVDASASAFSTRATAKLARGRRRRSLGECDVGRHIDRDVIGARDAIRKELELAIGGHEAEDTVALPSVAVDL